MPHTFVKICGITRASDGVAATEAGADAIGFIFAPSPRRVSPETASAIALKAGPTVLKIGVFVDETVDNLVQTVKQVGLDGVQLHGFEDSRFVEDLRVELPSITIFKVVRSGSAAGALAAEGLPIDAIFVDPKDGHHPTDPVDRLALEELKGLPGRVIVAGGLNPSNVGRLVAEVAPWGVDVSAGVEVERGIKDHSKVVAFIAAVRAASGEG